MNSKDSIQAVVVKKNQKQPQKISHTNVLKMSTTLPTYNTDNGARIPQKVNHEYKKRNPSNQKVNQRQQIPPKTSNSAGGVAQKIQLSKAGQSATTSLTGVGRLPIQQQTRAINIQALNNAMTSVQRTSHNNYEIQTRHVIQNRSIQQVNSKKDRFNAKMLVILATGEQRLITFTLPRESCTVHGLLEQVNVSFDNETTIECVDSCGANIDFVVSVGFSVQETTSNTRSSNYHSNNMDSENTNMSLQMPTSLIPTYYTENKSNNACLIKSRNGAYMTLSEYKKHNPSTLQEVKGQPKTTNSTSVSDKIQLSNNTGQSANISLTGVAPIATQHSIKHSNTQQNKSSIQRTSHNNYVILTQNVIQNRAQNYSKKDANMAKMLIFLASAGQRLITFNLPKESCDIQSLLHQIGVPFNDKTTIQCVDSRGANIDFVVTVGFLVQESHTSNTFVEYQSNNMEQPQSAHTASKNDDGNLITTHNVQRQKEKTSKSKSFTQKIKLPKAYQPAMTLSTMKQISHNNYEIQTQHVIQNRSINQNFSKEDRNSAKMLVILSSREQRLISFTLPRESCTVQDLLEQVYVPFNDKTTIQCVESPGSLIDFVVTVGFLTKLSTTELISQVEEDVKKSLQQKTATLDSVQCPMQRIGAPRSSAQSVLLATTSSYDAKKYLSNNSSEENPIKVIEGFLALCQYCGFWGYDCAKCERCKRVFSMAPKKIPIEKLRNVAQRNANAAEAKAKAEETKKRNALSETWNRLPKKTLNALSGRRRKNAASSERRIQSARNKPTESKPVTLNPSSYDDGENDDQSNNSTHVVPVDNNVAVTKPSTFEPDIFAVNDVNNNEDHNLTQVKWKVDPYFSVDLPLPLLTPVQYPAVISTNASFH